MGRSDMAAVVAEAAAGARVLYVAGSWPDAHLSFVSALLIGQTRARRVLRAAGRELVEFDGGGWVRFLSRRSSGHRGLTADAVVIDEAVRIDDRLVEDLFPVVASTGGRMAVCS